MDKPQPNSFGKVHGVNELLNDTKMMKDALVKPALDGLSITTIVGTFLGWLPHIAAILSVVWMAIRIYETDTVQRLIGRKGDG
jgi:hypothetical protein